MVYDTIIVGAGISGLVCAKELKLKGARVLVLEKSRNVGGRIAARRFENCAVNLSFDSFVANHPTLKTMCLRAWEEGLLRRTQETDKYDALGAMTDWTKSLAKDIEILKETLIQRIVRIENIWQLHSAGKDVFKAKKIILTLPAPQLIELLTTSNLRVPLELFNVEYQSEIFYFCVVREFFSASTTDELILVSRNKIGETYLCRYKARGWSELAREDLKRTWDELIRPLESWVHKWRYAKVLTQCSSDMQLTFKDQELYLAGDYFYGDDLNASVSSASYLLGNLSDLGIP